MLVSLCDIKSQSWLNIESLICPILLDACVPVWHLEPVQVEYKVWDLFYDIGHLCPFVAIIAGPVWLC